MTLNVCIIILSFVFLRYGLFSSADMMSGFIAVAPVSSRLYSTRFHGIRTPTLMVYGELDTKIAPEAMEAFKLLPNHQVCVQACAVKPAYLCSHLWPANRYNYRLMRRYSL